MDPPRWLLYGLNHPFWPVNDFKVQAWKMKILLCHLFQAVVLSHLEVGPKTVGVYRCMGVCVCVFVCLFVFNMDHEQPSTDRVYCYRRLDQGPETQIPSDGVGSRDMENYESF